MTLQEFKETLRQSNPPTGVSNLLLAMWHDANDDWETAHTIAQDVNTEEGSWVHAYLHRKEGDLGNASYWYHRARRTVPVVSLQEEWEQIVSALL